MKSRLIDHTKRNQMKLDFTKKQYETLIWALQITGSIYGVMGDMVDKKYKKKSNKLDELEDHVLGIAKEMGLEDILDEFQGKRVVDEEYLNKVLDDLNEYEEYSFWDNLARKLAERDLLRKLGREKVRSMDTIEYIDAEYPVEDEYHREFETHGLERVKIDK